jgi:hypothetical protein
VVEDVSDLAPWIVQTVRNLGAALVQAQAGRQQVLRLYEWDALADQLERLWLGCVHEDLLFRE